MANRTRWELKDAEGDSYIVNRKIKICQIGIGLLHNGIEVAWVCVALEHKPSHFLDKIYFPHLKWCLKTFPTFKSARRSQEVVTKNVGMVSSLLKNWSMTFSQVNSWLVHTLFLCLGTQTFTISNLALSHGDRLTTITLSLGITPHMTLMETLVPQS